MYDTLELTALLLSYRVPRAGVSEIIRSGGDHDADKHRIVLLDTDISLSSTPIELRKGPGNRHTLYIGARLTATPYIVDVKVPPRNSLRTYLKKTKKYFDTLFKKYTIK